MTRFYYVLGAVGVIGIGIVAYSVVSQTLGAAATQPVEVEGLDDMSKLVSLAQGITRGSEDAPITVVEFADYSCPSCAAFSASTKPTLFAQYIDNGKAKFVYYDFPLISIHPNSFVAARAGRCAADQDKFWEFQEIAFRNQNSWAMKRSGVLDDLTGFAEEAGADKGQFEQCLHSDEHADVVSANLRLATELGIQGTPTIMVSAGHGMARMLQRFDFEGIKEEIDRLIEEAATADSTSGSGN